MNKKINIQRGILLILFVAVIVGMVVILNCEKLTRLDLNQSFQTRRTGNSIIEKNITQPMMPTTSDEAGKNPEELVKDFYKWYIASTDYFYYQIHKSSQDPIDVKELTGNSPFVSSRYVRNIKKREGMYDSVLCTNDNKDNIVKEYGKASISGNNAEVDILRGWSAIENNFTKIKITLVKEHNQWKINDILCPTTE
ncbi:hypothetical protein EPO05_04510 [Patescibacteria group bacterium]|nr:MAG: hypothetical protein EPO05_04510 [Patescibacteria group bacterium]